MTTTKQNAFAYILYKLATWHKENVPDLQKHILNDRYLDGLYEQAALGRLLVRDERFLCDIKAEVQKITEESQITPRNAMLYPFFICMASKDREAILKLFDRFVVADEGILEQDLMENYLFDDQSFSLEARDFGDDVPYQLIDEAIDHLKLLNKLMIYHRFEILVWLHRRHICWSVFHGKQVPHRFLLCEKSYYARDLKYKMFS